ncbi:hypothetical protein AAH154_19650, partial [Phocaeicola vulgatus]
KFNTFIAMFLIISEIYLFLFRTHVIYEVDGIIHYCVANIPGAVPCTSTLALTNATLPYAIRLADLGWKKACENDPGLKNGLNIVNGKIVFPAVAEAFGWKI